jgi:hypothetical protein
MNYSPLPGEDSGKRTQENHSQAQVAAVCGSMDIISIFSLVLSARPPSRPDLYLMLCEHSLLSRDEGTPFPKNGMLFRETETGIHLAGIGRA